MDVLIIEDEILSADRLVNLLNECSDDINVVAVLQTVKEGKEYFSSGDCPDLIIADISLSDGLCFSIFEGSDIQCPIIFTTAYDEYALRAFEYNSIAYLLKPIRKEDLEKAISKIPSKAISTPSDIADILKSFTKENIKWRERILVENGEESLPIKVNNITLFNYDLGATKIVMKDNSYYFCELSLDRLEEQLNPELFLRVSRRYIINIEDVKSIKRIDTKHSLITIRNSDEKIIATNIRCNRLKIMLDR